MGGHLDGMQSSELPWAHWLNARCPDIGISEGANGQVQFFVERLIKYSSDYGEMVL